MWVVVQVMWDENAREDRLIGIYGTFDERDDAEKYATDASVMDHHYLRVMTTSYRVHWMSAK